VIFKVIADGRESFDSGVMRANTPAKWVSVPLAGVNELKLVVTDAGDGINCDHADWAEAFLFGRPKVMLAEGVEPIESAEPTHLAATAYRISSGALKLNLSASGEIVALKLPGAASRQKISAGTELAGCTNAGNVVRRHLASGAVEFRRRIIHCATGNSATLIERFTPLADSVRWELTVQGEGKPWTTAIETQLRWPAASTNALRFWTAWDQPGGTFRAATGD